MRNKICKKMKSWALQVVDPKYSTNLYVRNSKTGVIRLHPDCLRAVYRKMKRVYKKTNGTEGWKYNRG